VHHHPSTVLCFLLFLSSQTLSALFNYISDCDEVFNYWEPTHYLQHGRGLQTWEYRYTSIALSNFACPDYALRSYAYLYPQVFVGRVAEQLGLSRVQQFYVIRWFLGVTCSLCQTYLYCSIKNHPGCARTGIPTFTFIFLLVSTGMFVSGTGMLKMRIVAKTVAYLPSSFAMYCFMVAEASWLSGR
jgi:alpha-1,2-mannosyltransferase